MGRGMLSDLHGETVDAWTVLAVGVAVGIQPPYGSLMSVCQFLTQRLVNT